MPDGWLGMLRESYDAPPVLKEVAVRGLPMASVVDVMEQGSWYLPYSDGKLGERMQFGALGSTVHGPEVTVK